VVEREGGLALKIKYQSIEYCYLMPVLQFASASTDTLPTQTDYDIAIVGGGIVGNTIALALQASGLEVAIIEAQAESMAVIKNRAYAISLKSGEIFDRLGIWQRVLPQITSFSQIQISDADYGGVVRLYPEDIGKSVLGYGVSHQVLLTEIDRQLQASTTLTRLCPAEVTDVTYTATAANISLRTADGSEGIIRARLVIGADGAKSPLRQRAQIPTRGWNYWQSCVTATIKPEIPHQNIAYERFWYDGPIGVLPLADGRCQVVWTKPHADAAELLEISAAEFIDRLEVCTGGLLGKLELDSQRWLFPVKLMQSQQYTQPRLALIGDAAHCCHPVAGQGMNLGIRDAAALAEIITAAHAAGEDIGSDRVLARYDRQRKPQNLFILAFTDFLNRAFSNRFLPLVVTRRIGLFLLHQLPPLKSLSLKLMTGLLGR
jgi:2-octaprenyl-6-methoxyphenol hydroxylase